MIQPFHNQLDEWEEIRVKPADFVAGSSGIVSLFVFPGQYRDKDYSWASASGIFFFPFFPPTYK